MKTPAIPLLVIRATAVNDGGTWRADADVCPVVYLDPKAKNALHLIRGTLATTAEMSDAAFCEFAREGEPLLPIVRRVEQFAIAKAEALAEMRCTSGKCRR